MKKILSGILASTMILSSLSVTALAVTPAEGVASPENLAQTLSTTATTPESHFVCSGGVITGYIGTGGDVVIPSTINGLPVVAINDYAFASTAITTIVIPEGVQTIGDRVFHSCSSLMLITLPVSLKSIGDWSLHAISNCGVKVIQYAGTEEQYWQINASGFSNDCLINAIKVFNYNYDTGSSEEGSPLVPNPSNASPAEHFQFAGGVIVEYAGPGGDVVIPNHIDGIPVVAIEAGAFELTRSPYDYNVTSVVIPEGVVTIGDRAFRNCRSLVSITIPASVTYIGSWALHSFSNCAVQVINYTGTEEQFTQISCYWLSNDRMGGAIKNYNYVVPEPTIEIEGVPDWAQSYAGFVAPSIMPDISGSNYNDETNRGLIAQSIFNMAGDGGTYTTSFNDAGSNASAIGWCYNNGIMAGTSATWFASEDKVTREQCALILRQLAVSQGKDITASTSSLSAFSDQGDISSWAAEGVAWAVEQGLMAGSNGKLSPQGYVTRIQVAVMLKAFSQL